jgi:hypothetical protein
MAPLLAAWSVPSHWWRPVWEVGTMQEAEVLVALAEIAGVFVGFGALIAVRSGGASDAREVAGIRAVLSFGVWVIAAALVPVTLGAYDIGEREVWFVSSLVALAGFVGVWVMNRLTPEMQDFWAGRGEWRTPASRSRVLVEAGGWTLVVLVILAALVFVVLGLFPDQEPALYLTAVVLGLFFAALSLLSLVFAQRGPQRTPDKAEQPAE